MTGSSTPKFEHEPDATRRYWHNSPANTLPPPDMVGNYQRCKPLPTEGIESRRAWIVGGGIAGMAAAFYLIRDGHMPGENITPAQLAGDGQVECGRGLADTTLGI